MKKNKVPRKRSNSKASKTSPDLSFTYDELENIKIHGEPRRNTKAEQSYLDVTFTYEDGSSWEGAIPIQCRRAGIDLQCESEIKAYLKQSHIYCHPSQHQEWIEEQQEFWGTENRATVTKPLFDKLLTFQWTCSGCVIPGNTNIRRRIQKLRDDGYTIATKFKVFCKKCDSGKTYDVLVPLPRRGTLGYEIMSPCFRSRCFTLLKNYDVYEAKPGKEKQLVVEHKFPEIRWDSETRRESLDDLTDNEIINDFQLMTNQRNQQKREVCRSCKENGVRGYPFGIKFYYQGDERWPSDVPEEGKDAEKGCLGCGWYDMEKWRDALNQKLAESAKDD
jgi:hypothetical protein